ncbi:GNAT family N-acetyltransferase [Paenibacillus sp. GbtcB18]|uniref:GNAT family N-acetyltransferase n=1 Tax=Paenibacillus sp. GbtcB18 TaxID=2824763 RepID=UPI001C2FFE21|nr:GNAT family N-acetyltransferase [Paenibacillus sp. GbtcB18]
MIRKRIPAKDDRILVRLTEKELLPYTRMTVPEANVNLSEMKKRFKLGETFVVDEGSSAAGFVSVQVSDDSLFVDMLAVDSRFQGRGLGTSLMEHAERYGRKLKCRASRLYVDSVNEKAISFYLSKGYAIKSYVPQLRIHLMEKGL